MENTITMILFRVAAVANNLASLAVVACAFFAAIVCTRKKTSPLGAWGLVVGWGGVFFFGLLGYAAEAFLGKTMGYGSGIFSAVCFGLDFVQLVFLAIFIVGLALLRPPSSSAQAAQEVSHGR